MNDNDRSRYWKGSEKPGGAPGASEFAEELPRGAFMLKRRDFLHVAGFAAAVAATTGCSRAPVHNAIPMLLQPEPMVPGTSLHYATTCGGCSAGCGVLAKVRDGRPIKLEGNPQHPLSRGGLCAVGQASLLGLYDSQRLKAPMQGGREIAWEALDAEITKAFSDLRAGKGSLRLVTASVISPTTRSIIDHFLAAFENAKHIQYDPVSYSAILDAHEKTHKLRAIPHYKLERAAVIVAVDADFLGTWLSPVEFAAAYREGRKLDVANSRCSWHVQFESRMSLTGSKADERYTIVPSERSELLQQIATRIEVLSGKGSVPTTKAALSVPAAFVDKVANNLWQARGRSIVISSSNDLDEQLLVNRINHLLGNYGSTLELAAPSYQAAGSDQALSVLMDELRQGHVEVLLVAGVNPVFDLPSAIDAIRRVPLVISFAPRMDETALLANYVAPEPHFLEAWSDAEPVAGIIATSQPTMQRFGQTRTLAETLSRWMGTPASDYELMQQHWKAAYLRHVKDATFDTFWDQSVQDGFVELAPISQRVGSFNDTVVGATPKAASARSEGYSLVLYPTVAMRAGSEAYNPWLHELPDPVTKVTWDNYACLSPATASKLGVVEGDVVRIASEQFSLDLPAYVQPGQHDGVIAVPLGYGSVLSRRFANIGPRWIDALPSVGSDGYVGKNAATFVTLAANARRFEAAVQIKKTDSHQVLASTQSHHELSVPEKLAKLNPEPRPIIQETTLDAYQKDPSSGVHEHQEREDLWPADHPYKGHHWAMVVDLEACSGCSACVIACQAENNIPVVGKDEVRRNREMHWIRIDRYYSKRGDGRVDVAFQPLMCQQCENAPCETVCPVLATVHSEEGLSQQVYNRCVGTRYCANNCPYKGRRFNWFNYSRDDKLSNLVLNPDVTVRSRGVMEKCSFCVQRIEAARIDAKQRGTDIADGDIQTACQQSCPAKSIYFGDLNDPNSEVALKMRDPRRYRVLSELNVRPAVGYLTIVRNRDENPGGEHHG